MSPTDTLAPPSPEAAATATPQVLLRAIEVYRQTYNRRLLIGPAIRTALLMLCAVLGALVAQRDHLTWWWVALPSAAGMLVQLGLEGWRVFRGWLGLGDATTELDHRLHLKERLITSAQWAESSTRPRLYETLLEDVQRHFTSATTQRWLPRRMNAVSYALIALALALLILWLWPQRLAGGHEGRASQDHGKGQPQQRGGATPGPSSAQGPSAGQPGAKDQSSSVGAGGQSQQQSGSSGQQGQSQGDAGGQQGEQGNQGNAQGQGAAGTGTSSQQQGGSSNSQGQSQGSSAAGQEGQQQSGASGTSREQNQSQGPAGQRGASGQQGQQPGGTSGNQQPSPGQSGRPQGGASGDQGQSPGPQAQQAGQQQAPGSSAAGQQAQPSSNAQPVSPNPSGTSPSNANAPTPGNGQGTEQLQGEVKALLQQLAQQLDQMKQQLPEAKGAAPGTNTDPNVLGQPESLPLPVATEPIPLELQGDVAGADASAQRKAVGPGNAEGPVDYGTRAGVRVNDAARIGAQQAQEGATPRRYIPSEYQGVIDQLHR